MRVEKLIQTVFIMQIVFATTVFAAGTPAMKYVIETWNPDANVRLTNPLNWIAGGVLSAVWIPGAIIVGVLDAAGVF